MRGARTRGAAQKYGVLVIAWRPELLTPPLAGCTTRRGAKQCKQGCCHLPQRQVAGRRARLEGNGAGVGLTLTPSGTDAAFASASIFSSAS
eukprot:907610-Prymnesium_polylepis.1